MLPSARQIRAARGLLGISQAEMAKLAGVSRSALVRLESESGTSTDRTRMRLGETLESRGIQFLGETAEALEGVILMKSKTKISRRES